MKPIYAIVVYVLERLEDSREELAFFAWLGGTYWGSSLLWNHVPHPLVWGMAVGFVCAVVAWVVSWASGQGAKAMYRVYRPKSKLVKRVREPK